MSGSARRCNASSTVNSAFETILHHFIQMRGLYLRRQVDDGSQRGGAPDAVDRGDIGFRTSSRRMMTSCSPIHIRSVSTPLPSTPRARRAKGSHQAHPRRIDNRTTTAGDRTPGIAEGRTQGGASHRGRPRSHRTVRRSFVCRARRRTESCRRDAHSDGTHRRCTRWPSSSHHGTSCRRPSGHVPWVGTVGRNQRRQVGTVVWQLRLIAVHAAAPWSIGGSDGDSGPEAPHGAPVTISSVRQCRRPQRCHRYGPHAPISLPATMIHPVGATHSR